MSEGHPLKPLSKDISFIWHGVNDLKNLEFFLKSDIYWAEGDLRAEENGTLVLRHDPWDSHPFRTGESRLEASEWLDILLKSGRGIQIDIKEGGATLESLIRLLKDRHVPEERMWFTTNLKDIALEDYGRLAREFPKVPLQSAIPLRFMFQDMSAAERGEWLGINRSIGVRHLAMSWYEEPAAEELKELREAGFGVHFFYVNTAADILKAAALKPDSITSDFHVPEWGLFGRGSGENGFYLEKT
jgi:hypothetical protein